MKLGKKYLPPGFGRIGAGRSWWGFGSRRCQNWRYLPLTGQNAFGGQLETGRVQLANKAMPTGA